MDPTDQAPASAPGGLLTKYEPQNVRAVLVDRMTLSHALTAVSVLLDRWPNGRANLSDGYIGGLAAVLTDYPRIVAAKACGPAGIVRKSKFLPTIAELDAYCKAEVEPLIQVVARDDRARANRKAMDALGREGARESRPTLAELQAHHGGPSWGLAEPEDPERFKRAHLANVQNANERAWARGSGTMSGGILVTDALRKTIDPTLGAVNRQSPGDVDPPEGQRDAEDEAERPLSDRRDLDPEE